MYEIFADLHVHIGRSETGKPVKITGARSLNFANIAKECAEKKGINVPYKKDNKKGYPVCCGYVHPVYSGFLPGASGTGGSHGGLLRRRA